MRHRKKMKKVGLVRKSYCVYRRQRERAKAANDVIDCDMYQGIWLAAFATLVRIPGSASDPRS
jgi:hypothetical protein